MGINGIVKRNRAQSFVTGILVFLAVLWASVNPVLAQASAQKKNFLWSVKSDTATMYLLGSVHLLKSGSYPLDKNIEAAYRDCKTVVFETDIGGMKTPAVQQKMMALALYPEGQTLKQSISPETYSKLEEKVAEVGLPIAQLNQLRPWMCALTLVLLELQKMGFDPSYGIDHYFYTKALQDKKETVYLEPVEYQLGLFADMDAGEEEAFLQQTLKDLEVVKTMFADIVSAWERGDAARLESILSLSFKDYPEIYDRFLAQRNKAWTGTLERLMEEGGSAFVVVGAGHLVGPDNLLQLLKEKGYVVEQVSGHAAVTAVPAEDLTPAFSLTSGMEEHMRALSLAIQKGFDQATNQDDRIQQVSKDFYATVKKLIVESFAAERLDAVARRHMEAQLDQAEMGQIIDWLNSSLGRECSDLFKTSLTPEYPAELQEFLTAIQKSPPPSSRLALIRELAHATQTMETSLEIAVTTQLVATTVVDATLPSLQQRPFSEIFDAAEKDRPLLEPRVEQRVTSLLLYICRSLSDAEIEQYITSVRSGIGAQYYRSLYTGIKLALMDASIRFGSAMADLQWRRKQGVRTVSAIDRRGEGYR